MKLLITGGAGSIGSNFIHYQRQQHPEDTVGNVDVLSTQVLLDAARQCASRLGEGAGESRAGQTGPRQGARI